MRFQILKVRNFFNRRDFFLLFKNLRIFQFVIEKNNDSGPCGRGIDFELSRLDRAWLKTDLFYVLSIKIIELSVLILLHFLKLKI